MDEKEQENLREKAREHIEDMPAETALGHADPQGPHDEEPQQWEAEHQGPEN
jgi:hypothetical protein